MKFDLNFTEYDREYINDKFTLRKPQAESLVILERIVTETNVLENADMTELLKQIHEWYPTLTNFERDFPSFCFALATGVGKTRLMAAFITYLYTDFGVKHFFVLAPNLTIYNKLIRDFGDPSYEKYLFRGIDVFEITPPRIVTGDTYKEQVAGQQAIAQSVEINVFNISKINAETRKGNEPNIKRLSEFIGQSYFDYLANLPDLCLIMDESHHYRADRGMKVINELKPKIGLELTATPQTESSKGPVKFKNVVYEYSLAKAITDGFVKEPSVATRVDFDPKKYQAFEIDRFKLIDGLRLHRATKTELELYAKTEDKKLVKPFVLVVCRDTTHAAEIKEYTESMSFFDGFYKKRVVEVHSSQTSTEKDENIQKLLNLESAENTVEIVIHVNMLKEGWDVTNLYTIIPLRTATSTTLREQTIGRGLRLPYGTKTGHNVADRLTIVAHDKFEEIIAAANEEGSIIKRENIINIGEIEDLDKDKEVIQTQTLAQQYLEKKQLELEQITDKTAKTSAKQDLEIEKAISEVLDEVVHAPQQPNVLTNKNAENTPQTGTFAFAPFASNATQKETPTKQVIATSENHVNITKTDDLHNKNVEEAITEMVMKKLNVTSQISIFDETPETMLEKVKLRYSPMISQKIRSTIDIPDIAMIPINEVTYKYFDFKLNTENMTFTPVSEDILVETLKGHQSSRFSEKEEQETGDTIEDLIVGELILHEEIDYQTAKQTIESLINQAKLHFLAKYSAEQLENIVKYHRHDIAEIIFDQILQSNHFIIQPPTFETKIINAVSPILSHNYSKYKAEEIMDYREIVAPALLSQKVFGQFEKACHTEYKFDSEPEHIFSVIIERDEKVEKWLRPAPKQFKIYWRGGQMYEPDFVVETAENIYMVEVKASKNLNDEEVLLKAKSAYTFCENVNKMMTGQKAWKYMLLGDNEVSRSTTFEYLIKEIQLFGYHEK